MTSRKDEIERLFRAHYPRMKRLARVLLHDDDAACDVVHDVFASLLRPADGDTAQANVGEGYLLSAVRNRCLNHIRNTEARERLSEAYFADIADYETEDWPDEEIIARLNAVLATGLTSQCRKVVELRFAGSMKYGEIASALGISEVAVYKHLRHAIEIIRKKII